MVDVVAPAGYEGRHPGWPARLGPLRVPAGVVALRAPKLRDGNEWSRIRLRDRDHLEYWEPNAVGRWEDRNSVTAWFSQWGALRSLGRRGMSLPFVITVDGAFAGQITVGNVVRGALCSAWVGYWVAADLVRGGVASASVALVVDHCFVRGGLHRLEATVRPANDASIGVLRKVGFREEGVFRRYLDVAGEWRDHLCFAVTLEDVPEGMTGRLISQGRAQHP